MEVRRARRYQSALVKDLNPGVLFEYNSDVYMKLEAHIEYNRDGSDSVEVDSVQLTGPETGETFNLGHVTVVVVNMDLVEVV